MCLLEAETFAVEDQLPVVDEGHAVAGGEGLGAGSYEVDVRTLIEDEAGGLDGIADVLDTGYAAGAEGGAIHEQGVELNAAVGGKEAAATGVEGGIVLKDGDGGFYGVGGAASPVEDGVAGLKGATDTTQVVFGHIGRDSPGSTVYEERGFGAGEHLGRTKGKTFIVPGRKAGFRSGTEPNWGANPKRGSCFRLKKAKIYSSVETLSRAIRATGHGNFGDPRELGFSCWLKGLGYRNKAVPMYHRGVVISEVPRTDACRSVRGTGSGYTGRRYGATAGRRFSAAGGHPD